jgi:protein TonB
MALRKTEKASLVLSLLGHALLVFVAVSMGGSGPGGGKTLMVEMVEGFPGSAGRVYEGSFPPSSPKGEEKVKIEELPISPLPGKTEAGEDAVEREKSRAVNEKRETEGTETSPQTAVKDAAKGRSAVARKNPLSSLSDKPDEEAETAAFASSSGASGFFSLPEEPVGGAGEEKGGGNRMALTVNVKSAIQNAVVYPLLARKRGMEGTVLAEIFIGFEGKPYEIKVRESSGHGILDREAVRAVRNASPYPGFRGVVEVPVTFRLNDDG